MTPRVVILCAVYGLPLVTCGFALLGWSQLRTFLDSHTSISNERELDELKGLVKANMYLALAIIATVVLMVILGGIGMGSGFVRWWELTGLLIFAPVGSVGGALLTALESQVRKLPAEDESLREELDHVLKRWTANALPDW